MTRNDCIFFGRTSQRKKQSKDCFFLWLLSKPRLGISSPREAWCISSRALCALVSHHAKRAFPCGLMIYRNKLRMIYNTSC